MELATAVFLITLAAVVFAIVALPLLAISRLLRMLKNSYAKLFKARVKKA